MLNGIGAARTGTASSEIGDSIFERIYSNFTGHEENVMKTLAILLLTFGLLIGAGATVAGETGDPLLDRIYGE